jgi:hypothetical protein
MVSRPDEPLRERVDAPRPEVDDDNEDVEPPFEVDTEKLRVKDDTDGEDASPADAR